MVQRKAASTCAANAGTTGSQHYTATTSVHLASARSPTFTICVLPVCKMTIPLCVL